MKFFTYAALVFGVSALRLDQQSTNGQLDLANEELFLSYPEAPINHDLAEISEGDDPKADEDADNDDEEDDLLKAVKAVIAKKGSVTMPDIKMIIKGKLKDEMHA